VNRKVKAVFKLHGNRDREELAHCAVLTIPVEEFSHLQSSGSNEGENMDAPLQDCTTEEHCDIVRFLLAGVKPVKIHLRMLAQYGQSTISQRKVYEWVERRCCAVADSLPMRCTPGFESSRKVSSPQEYTNQLNDRTNALCCKGIM
jgi:hypothetical protein